MCIDCVEPVRLPGGLMTAKLRALWLAPIQLPVVDGGLSNRGGGWIEGWRWALEAHSPGVELAILGYGPFVHEPFAVGNATFFSFKPEPSNKYRELLRRWSHHYPVGDSGHESFNEALTTFRPDIIHVHGSESGLAKLSAASDVPTVLSLQGIATIWQRFMFSGQTCLDVVRDSASVHFLKGSGYLHSYMTMRDRAATERRILDDCRYVLGNTEWDKRVATVLCPSAIYYHGDRAVRREFYDHQWQQSPGGDPVIYCTSGSAPYKGLEILLHAVALLRGAGFPTLRVRIAGAAVGGGNWPALRRVIRQLRVDDAVSLLGVIDASAMVSELTAATVFVLPSHIENESNALIEAMLVGTPCVAAAVGGVPSIMRDRVDGLLYQDRDPFALAGAIHRLIADSDFATSLAATGRATAHRRHDPANVANQLVSAYEDVIARAGRSRAWDP